MDHLVYMSMLELVYSLDIQNFMTKGIERWGQNGYNLFIKKKGNVWISLMEGLDSKIWWINVKCT
jgi:hypothetical protein